MTQQEFIVSMWQSLNLYIPRDQRKYQLQNHLVFEVSKGQKLYFEKQSHLFISLRFNCVRIDLWGNKLRGGERQMGSRSKGTQVHQWCEGTICGIGGINLGSATCMASTFINICTWASCQLSFYHSFPQDIFFSVLFKLKKLGNKNLGSVQRFFLQVVTVNYLVFSTVAYQDPDSWKILQTSSSFKQVRGYHPENTC